MDLTLSVRLRRNKKTSNKSINNSLTPALISIAPSAGQSLTKEDEEEQIVTLNDDDDENSIVENNSTIIEIESSSNEPSLNITTGTLQSTTSNHSNKNFCQNPNTVVVANNITTDVAAATTPIASTNNTNNNNKLATVSSVICRICHNNEQLDHLISPCHCKGTLAYVHRDCVERWLTRAGIMHCELCRYHFRTNSTLRYGFFESLRIFFQTRNNREHLKGDLLLCTLLTVVTFGLSSIGIFGLHYLLLNNHNVGFAKMWTQGTIIVFLVIVILAYLLNICLLLKGQIVPWYTWWQSARQVHIVVNNNR